MDFSYFGTDIDSSGKTAYEEIKSKYKEDSNHKDNLIFDDEQQTLWLVS